MATVTNLPVDLEDLTEELLEGDEILQPEQLKGISLFSSLKRPPNFGKFPGSTVLRKCPAGRVMCTQGQKGATAFFILTTQDMIGLRESQIADLTSVLDDDEADIDRAEVEAEIRRYREHLESLRAEAGGDARSADPRVVASARLLLDLEGTRRRGLLHRLADALKRRPRTEEGTSAAYIPIDGPADIDTSTLSAPLHEGDLFGEMSCFNRAPRSATVIVNQDCYMIEMLRNILDMLQKDDGYNEHMEAVYRKRVLETHIRKLSIFEDLSDSEFATLQGAIKLENRESGQIIFDEHDDSDCFYVIRSGLVKVVKNLCVLFGPADIPKKDRGAVVQGLQAARSADSISQTVVSRLPPNAQAVLDGAGDGAVSDSDFNTLVAGLNEFIKDREVVGVFGKKTPDILATVEFDESSSQVIAEFEGKPGDWSDVESRIFQRLLLEKACPALPRRELLAGSRRVLAYLGRGEFIGEIGVMADAQAGTAGGSPRSATCVAYDHPDSGQKDAGGSGTPSRVELVRIDADDFRRLVASSPTLKERVEQVIAKRRSDTTEQMSRTSVNVADAVRQIPEFEELGLIQGQQLMLIDLDRCTRCGECVSACVDAHEDGRTRLYLDGPRFEKYLVPLTCRKCLDPVCMIGCPVGAIQRGDNNEIQIENWCIGCSLCADQCPYGSIQMNALDAPVELSTQERQLLGPDATVKPVTDRAVVCDMCSTTRRGEPSCVYSCPHDAAFRVNSQEFFFDFADDGDD